MDRHDCRRSSREPRCFYPEACKQRLKSLRAKELDRQYTEGYRKQPEELDWAEASVKLLSKRLPKEKW
jgi:hypothetical protein